MIWRINCIKKASVHTYKSHAHIIQAFDKCRSTKFLVADKK